MKVLFEFTIPSLCEQKRNDFEISEATALAADARFRGARQHRLMTITMERARVEVFSFTPLGGPSGIF